MVKEVKYVSVKAKKTRQEQPEQIQLMCAYDKSRPCNATCTAFYIIHSANGATWGCKRLG